MTVCYHFLWLTILVFGLVFRDSFARVLHIAAAAQVPVVSMIVMINPQVAEVPFMWRLSYVLLIAVSCLVIARLWRSRWFLTAFATTAFVGMYAGGAIWFRSAVVAVGRPAMMAFSWSVGMLLLAFLISAHKAHWLPRLSLPKWPARSRPQQPALDEPPDAAQELSFDESQGEN